MAEARKKNLLRILVWLHVNEILYLGTAVTFHFTDLAANQIARDEEVMKLLMPMLEGSWIFLHDF